MVEEKVKEIISKQLGVSSAEIQPETSFVEDLGADSLDTVVNHRLHRLRQMCQGLQVRRPHKGR